MFDTHPDADPQPRVAGKHHCLSLGTRESRAEPEFSNSSAKAQASLSGLNWPEVACLARSPAKKADCIAWASTSSQSERRLLGVPSDDFARRGFWGDLE